MMDEAGPESFAPRNLVDERRDLAKGERVKYTGPKTATRTPGDEGTVVEDQQPNLPVTVDFDGWVEDIDPKCLVSLGTHGGGAKKL